MNIEQSPEDEIITTEPKTNTHPAPQSRKQRHWVAAVVAFLVVAAVYVGGVLPRVKARTALKTETAEMAIPTVAVVQPQPAAPAQELVLPANVQPYIVAPIYARTNGYLKAWYVDIGAHVKQGQLLAVIETPEIDH
jgi:multidrug efflux pump subunit AcrA (membrane-fusion protein)